MLVKLLSYLNIQTESIAGPTVAVMEILFYEIQLSAGFHRDGIIWSSEG